MTRTVHLLTKSILPPQDLCTRHGLQVEELGFKLSIASDEGDLSFGQHTFKLQEEAKVVDFPLNLEVGNDTRRIFVEVIMITPSSANNNVISERSFSIESLASHTVLINFTNCMMGHPVVAELAELPGRDEDDRSSID